MNYFNIIGGLLIVLCIPFIVYLYVKYDKEYKPNFNEKYFCELPGDFTPAEMVVLLNKGQPNYFCITSILLDLVRKKQLFLLRHTEKGEDVGTPNYCFALNKAAPFANLKKHEAYVLNWFTGIIGNGERVYFNEIADCAKYRKNRLFRKDYYLWTRIILQEAGENNFYERSSTTASTVGLSAGFGYLLLGFVSGLASWVHPAVAILLFFSGIVVITFASRLTKFTVLGLEQHNKWKAFLNYLRDFSRIDIAAIPKITTWEHFLVYVIPFNWDLPVKVIEQLAAILPSDDLRDEGLTYMRDFNDVNEFSRSLNEIISFLNKSIREAMRYDKTPD